MVFIGWLPDPLSPRGKDDIMESSGALQIALARGRVLR
jgi:hypothetical protein